MAALQPQGSDAATLRFDGSRWGGLGSSVAAPGAARSATSPIMTRKHISLLLSGAVLLGASCTSLWNAGTAGPKFQNGSYRLGGGMGVNFSDSEFNAVDTDTLALSFDVGRFYTENLELGLRADYTSIDAGGAETDMADYLVFGRWYVTPGEATRPWIELAIGSSNVDNGATDLSGLLYSVGLGLTQFLSDRVALEVAIRNSVGNYDNDIESDSLDLGVGLAVFW